MEELAEHYDEVSRLGRTEIAGSIPSYWGPTQTRRAYYPGIESVTTAGHGGFIVSPELNELVDPEWRNDAGNYEEDRSEEHTSELQSLMRSSYAVFCLKKKKHN